MIDRRGVLTASIPLVSGCLFGGGGGRTRSRAELAVERHRIARLHDPDAVEIRDLTGNGTIDIVAATSTGRPAVYWLAQGETADDWSPHTIDDSTGFGKIEGVDVFSVDGTTVVATLDQGNGTIYLSRPRSTGEPRGTWETAAIDTAAPLVQCSLDTDLTDDGRPDLVYVYEGRRHGQTGAVAALTYEGGPILEPGSWRKHVLHEHDGSWWIAQNRPPLGDGDVGALVVASRESGRSDHLYSGQVFWLEQDGADPWQWTPHVIDDGDEYAPLHVTTGDLDGDGRRTDIAAGALDRGTGLYLYHHADDWQRTRIHEGTRFQNVRALDLTAGSRSDLYVNTTEGHGMILTYRDGAWRTAVRYRVRKTDDRAIPVDVDGDGSLDLVTCAAKDGTVDWWSYSPTDDSDIVLRDHNRG